MLVCAHAAKAEPLTMAFFVCRLRCPCCSCCTSAVSCPPHTQAYSMLHTAADGKLPRITALLHVEAFHALCQHTDLVTKVHSRGPPAVVTWAAFCVAVRGTRLVPHHQSCMGCSCQAPCLPGHLLSTLASPWITHCMTFTLRAPSALITAVATGQEQPQRC